MQEVTLIELWLPILVSGVAVFVVSSVIHMATPMHKKDHRGLPDEEGVLASLRGLPPASYVFPYASSMAECRDPAFLEKQKRGPVGFLRVLPAEGMQMGRSLVIWFLYSLLVSAFAGYVATLSNQAGADFGSVFRAAGTLAVVAYGVASVQDSIWKGVSWGVTLRFVVDGVVYGLVTGAVFGWLWPG